MLKRHKVINRLRAMEAAPGSWFWFLVSVPVILMGLVFINSVAEFMVRFTS